MEIPRDRWGRPMVIPPDGGKPEPYTRASRLGSVLTDRSQLTKWKQRQVALGLAKRPDLLTAVAARFDDKTALDELCEQAMQAVGSDAAATMGTALHQLTERLDLGQDMGEHVPPAAQTRVSLYRATLAAAQLVPVAVEVFVVNDHLKAAGTFDRLLQTPAGPVLVADLKTGTLGNGTTALYQDQAIEYAVQLAVYAEGQRYDPATGKRSPLHPQLDPTRGVIVALPALTGPCRLIGLDLAMGSVLAGFAASVLEARKTKNLSELRFMLEN